jgi:hypothetical protein
MPDLLGPDPCLACEVFGGPCCCDPEAWADTKGDACGPYAAYKAKRALLEALKAGGVKFDNPGDYDPTVTCDPGPSLRVVTVWECERCKMPVSRLDHECIPNLARKGASR